MATFVQNWHLVRQAALKYLYRCDQENEIYSIVVFPCKECTFTAHKRSLGQGNIFTGMCQSFCPRGSLYDVTSCLGAWSHVPSVGEVSVPGPMFLFGGLCVGVSVQGGFCSAGSMSGSLSETPPPQYGEEWAVHILLECFLVLHGISIFAFMVQHWCSSQVQKCRKFLIIFILGTFGENY